MVVGRMSGHHRLDCKRYYSVSVNRTRAFARGLRRALCSALTIAFLLASQTALAVSSDADEAAGTAKPGICTPVSLTLSDDASGDIHSDDTGVATYVGGDFVVGNKNTNQNWWSNTGIGGSYAGETEGVTIVKGDFLSRPLKGFFTMGMVAFGAQYLPADGSTVLTVGGKSQTLSGKGSPSHLQAWQQYTGIKSTTSPKDQAAAKSFTYNADIAGPMSDVWGQMNKNNSLQMYKGSKGFITTNDADALSHVKIGGTTHDYSNEDQHIADLSDNLAKLADTGTVTTGSAPSGTTTYAKYDATKSHTLTFTDAYSDDSKKANAEKLVYFTGDGSSALQVFTVTPEQLDSTGWRGTDFKFTNIPDGANVVINVTGQQVSWQNGWRLWWGNQQIGNGFSKNATAIQRKLYTDVAQKIMWNFPQAQDTTSGGTTTPGLTIHGAQTNESGQTTNSTDDPAAALLGSVLVPHASFDDHVTTNGRVWVGGDFMMDNPTPAGTSGSASVLDMDQERHNLPWNGAVSSTCSAVEWYKTNTDGSTFLSGSEWGVYASKADAENKQNAIMRVSDNGDNDWSPESGHLLLQSLVPNATYYITETGAPEGYTLNDKVYTVTTTQDGTVAKLTGDGTRTDPLQSAVNARRRRLAALSSDSAANGAVEDAARTINYIADTPNNLDWRKTDKSGNGNALAGSSWRITNDSGDIWEVTDTIGQTPALSVDLDSDQLTVGHQTKATANFASTPENMPSIEWRSSDPTIATIAADGTISAIAPGNVEIIARAGTQRAIAVLTVSSGSGDTPISEKGEFSLRGGRDMQPTATQKLSVYFGEDPLTDTQLKKVVWTSSDTAVASIDGDGTVRAKAAGTTTITATYRNDAGVTRSARLLLTVSSEGSDEQTQKARTDVWFQQGRRPGWTNGVYIHYSVDDGAHWTTVPQAMTQACTGWYKYTINGIVGKKIRIAFANAADLHAGQWDNGGKTDGFYAVDPSAETAVFYTGSMATNDTPPCAVEVEHLSITGDGVAGGKLSLKAGTAITLGVAVTPKQASAVGVTWKSSDPGIVAVQPAADSVSGTLMGATAGTATVTASITTSKGTVTDSIEVTITDDQPDKTGLTIVGPQQVRLGKTAQLSAKRKGVIATKVTWTSSDPDIVSVDASSGIVTGRTIGIAKITAASTDGKYAGSMFIIVMSDVLPSRTDTDPAAGRFSIGGLPDGIYHLYEDSAPDGYSKNNNGDDVLVTFRVNGGGIEVISYDKNYVKLADGSDAVPVISDPATTATWTKVDDTTAHDPLAGAVWTLTRYTDNTYTTKDTAFGTDGSIDISDCVKNAGDEASACTAVAGRFADIDPAAGKVKIAGLKNGWYRVAEKTAPAGYRLRMSHKDFHLDNSTWEGAHLSFGRIVNTKLTGTASWRKVDAADEDKLLAGSGWRLVRSWTQKDASGNEQKKTAAYTVVDNEGDGASCKASEPSGSEDGVLCDTDTAAGKFTVKGLKWGTYELSETQAPDKYLLNHNTFTVGEDQKTALIGIRGDSFVENIAFGPIGDENRQYALPITGSRWAVVGLFTALGLLLLLAGAISLGRKRD